METTAQPSLKTQLLERMAQAKVAIIHKLSAGPFGTGESRKDFEARIMNDESAWTNVSNKDRSTLPK